MDLPPEKEFALRAHQQVIKGMSRDGLVELAQELMRQLVVKDLMVTEMIKRKLL